MTDMSADATSADVFDALVDREGTVWVRLGSAWSYISDLTDISWDVHTKLPEHYAPYRGLDQAAARVIMAHVLGQLIEEAS